LFLCIDHEGGEVFRPGEPFTRFPANRVLGRTDPETVRAVGRAMARELRAVGVTWNFAPVVDVDTNPDNPIIGPRSFGPDPELVGKMGCALIRGLQDEGVAACAKHFPGHGDTFTDSHKVLPVVDKSAEDLERVELAPFARAAACGAASVMTAHVLYPAWDPERPATLSERIVGDLLRMRLEYDGVAVTDDLEMKAIEENHDLGDAAVAAINAGVDMLLVCRSADKQARILEALIEAARTDEIPGKRISNAMRRVQMLKSHFLSDAEPPDAEAARRIVGCAEHRRLAEQAEAAAQS